MNIKTLETVPVAEIAATFNEAFLGYFVRLEFTEESMAAKIRSEGIRLHYSIGAFEDGKLVGFMLHGYDVIDGTKTIYNAGTGVIAPYRGRGITASLYEFAILMLSAQGIHKHVLEVIDNNFAAINVYEKIGFRRTRTLQVFRGKPVGLTEGPYLVQKLESIPAETIAFSEMTSSWQNSIASVERDIETHQLIGVFQNGELIGFAAFVASTGRIKQLVVHLNSRRKGIGTALLSHIVQESTAGQLVATNVDEAYEPAIKFLQACGFGGFLRLYEMRLQVIP